MAGAIHEVWGLALGKSMEGEERLCQADKPSKVGSAYPILKHKVTHKSVWGNPPGGSHQNLKPQDAEPSYKALHCHDQAPAFVALLRSCAKTKDLSRGSKLHDDISKRGLLHRCSDALVIMYAKCGALAKAKELLDMYKSSSVVPWTALITGYARQGLGHDALSCFEQMRHHGISPDAVTFACMLKACGRIKAIDKGELIHDEIAREGLLENNIVLGNALVDMYAKCGDLAKAHRVLRTLPSRDAISWNALIAGYAQQGQGEEAFKCFEKMRHEGLSPDAVTFASILKACGSMKAAEKGEEIHNEISRQGLLGDDIVLSNALVDMYAKCGALTKAERVLKELPSRNIVTWNSLITGYAQQGQGEQALNFFECMQLEGLSPDAVSFICILKACGSIKSIAKGEQIHDEIARQGLLRNNIMLGTALVDMYAKCGDLGKARRVLEGLPSRSVISWNALISTYAQQDQAEQALDCFERMLHEGISPDAATFACILKACGTLRVIDKGIKIHDEIARQGLFEKNVMLGNALVDMYAKCGALTKAKQVLKDLPSRDVVSWNALITGYAQHGQGEEALSCFEQMQREDVSPDAVTFASILSACGIVGAVGKGKQVHDEIAKQGLLGNDYVLGNALVEMYAKCGALSKARQVLEGLPSQDIVAWSAVIGGYAQQGQGEQALDCFEQMQCRGLSPDAVTFSCILKACGTIGAIDKGEQIHEEVSRQGLLRNNIVLGTALVDMYAKCGALAKAQEVLDELPSRDVVSWSALIAGYAQQGQGEQVLNCFERMQLEGLSPNAVTFSCVLNVCSHLGLVEDGYMYFVNMSTKYGVKPELEHYTCMVDLFGRAGHLDKAARVIQEMPSSDNFAVWSALLAACRKWGDVNVGRWAFEQAVQVDKTIGTPYVLMADIYATAGMQEEAGNIEAMRMENIQHERSQGIVVDHFKANPSLQLDMWGDNQCTPGEYPSC